MSFAATHLVGFGAGGDAAGTAAITFAASAVDTTNVADSTYTFTAHSIGTAATDRYVIVTTQIRGGVGFTVTSCTVGGAATSTVVTNEDGGTNVQIWITSSPVTSGTTADIVVTVGGGVTVFCCGIATYAVTGLASNVATATATQDTDNTATNLTVSAGGVAVAAAIVSGATPTFTWTNLTERFDATIEASGASHTGACDNSTSGGTLSITCDASSGTQTRQAFAAFL